MFEDSSLNKAMSFVMKRLVTVLNVTKAFCNIRGESSPFIMSFSLGSWCTQSSRVAVLVLFEGSRTQPWDEALQFRDIVREVRAPTEYLGSILHSFSFLEENRQSLDRCVRVFYAFLVRKESRFLRMLVCYDDYRV